jgi:hypothetical protein
MITLEQQKQGEELLQTLVQKAWESTEFKEQLIENPLKVISGFSNNINLQGKRLIVEDQTDKSIIFLNIPPKIDWDSMELNEEQLEVVSGGSGWACTIGGAVLSYLLGSGDSGGGDTKVNVQVGSGNSNSQ